MANLHNSARIELMGAPGSPYTRKMVAYLRYRHIPYAMRWGGMLSAPKGYPKPKVRLMPTFLYQAKCLQWIRRAYGALSGNNQARTRAVLEGTGCEPLLD